MNRTIVGSWASLAGVIMLFASTAQGHIRLEDPPSRYDDSQIKTCPCGAGTDNGNCQSDPNRSATVTTLEAGSTIVVRWNEFIGHVGRYRVAFDDDGADLEDFNANILADIQDPQGGMGNTGDGANWELEVTLPDTPCDNCTLQLVQVVDQTTVDTPVEDPSAYSTYYTCADLILTAPEGETGGEETGGEEMGEAGAGAGGAEGMAEETGMGGEAAVEEDPVAEPEAMEPEMMPEVMDLPDPVEPMPQPEAPVMQAPVMEMPAMTGGSAGVAEQPAQAGSGGQPSAIAAAGGGMGGGAMMMSMTDSGSDEGGCSVTRRGGAGGLAVLFLSALGVMFVRRRR